MSLLGQAIAESGGTTTAKFVAIGDTTGGKVISVDMRQARDFDSGQPKVWDDGNPVMQAIITVDAGVIDPTITEDDGARSIYVKWYGAQRQSLIAAVRAVNDDDVRIGGTFTATYVGDAEPVKKGMSGAKLFAYQYVPPASPVAQAIAQTPAAQPAPQAPASAPAPASVPAAAAQTPPADPAQVLAQVRGLIALGMTDAQITAATGVTGEAIAAVRNIPA